MAENPEKINCKISYEPAETLLKSEDKNLTDYELLMIRGVSSKEKDGKQWAKIIVSPDLKTNNKCLIEIREELLNGEDVYNNEDIIESTMRLAPQLNIEFIASLTWNGTNFAATGLRRRSKTKTEPPPPITLPTAE